MKKHFTIILFLLLFLYFFLGIQFLYNEYNCDQIYQFGFSYALVRGEIPYLDYNMIVTPLSTLVYALPLLFKISYLFLNIFQALLLTLFFMFLFKKYNKQAYILLIVFSLFYPLQFVKIWYAGYSFLLIVEFFVLLYLEDKNDKGYLTGIMLSLVLLTKQTVGLPILLVLLYYYIVNRKKLINVLKTYFVLPLIFIIWLLITGSFNAFIDQCFLGLFDFATNNSLITIWFVVFVVESIFVIYRFIKTKNIKYLYLLLYSTCTLPAFDQYHFAIYEFLFIFVLIKDLDIELSKKYLCFVTITIMIIMPILYLGLYYGFNVKRYVRNYNHFEYYVLPDSKDLNVADKYVKKYKDKRLIVFSDNSFVLKIINNLPIEHYDLINYGNNGFNGTDKIIKNLNNEKDAYIITNYPIKNDYVHPGVQTNLNIIRYVFQNYELIYENEDNNIRIYYKE